MKGLIILGFSLCVVVVISLAIAGYVKRDDTARNPTDGILAFIDEDVKELEKKKIELEQEKVDLEILKVEDKQRSIPFWRHTKNYGILSMIFAVLAAIMLIAWGLYHKYSVHSIQIGKHSNLKVRYKDLGDLGVVMNGLVLSEQLRSHTKTEQKAFEMSLKLSELVTYQLRALSGRQGFFRQVQPIDVTPEQAALPAPVPSFSELLQKGQIAPGNPLIFGYTETGQAKTGTWVDLFSSAVGGVSGTGKTATLRNIIAQSLLTGQVETFWITDFHFPHPQSLLATLGDLKNLQAIRYVENPFDLPDLLQEVEATIDRRLRMEEASTPIKVLVCDEVLILCERIPQLKRIIKRIGTEARKCGVYGLFSAQTWKADAVGGSEVRDCLTSRFAHKMQPKQANLLLQDSDQSKQVKQLSTGKALFSPVNGVSEILSIPYCDPRDMKLVYAQIVDGNTVRQAKPAVLHKPIQHPEPEKSLKLRVSKSDFCDPGLDEFFTNISPQKDAEEEKIENGYRIRVRKTTA